MTRKRIDWVVTNTAEVLIELVNTPHTLEPTGSWPDLMPQTAREKTKQS
jgi:hypothetical protein